MHTHRLVIKLAFRYYALAGVSQVPWLPTPPPSTPPHPILLHRICSRNPLLCTQSHPPIL